MYARTVGERELTFQVSGFLWERSLVMRDPETGSLWSQLLGRAMKGRLKGEALKLIPATLTTWKKWREVHPKSGVLALSRTAKQFDASVWNKPNRFVYGLPAGVGEKSPAVTLSRLLKDRLVAVKVGAEQVVVTVDALSRQVQAFGLERNDGLFVPAGEGLMRDEKTGSRWDAVTGRCLSGLRQGDQLEARACLVSYRRAWEVFHPDSLIHE